MDGENQNVPNESPVSSAPAPAAPEQPSAQPAPSAPEPAPAQQERHMGDMGAGAHKKGMGKGLMWAVVVIAVLVVVYLVVGR